MRIRALGVGLAAMTLATVAFAHEERLVIGRVERLDLGARLLVVQDPERDRTVQITLDPETEVRRCRLASGLATVRPGAKVRVKYLDRGGGVFHTLSLLVLPDSRGR